MKLSKKHSALKKNYKESYYAKVGSIAPIVQSLPLSPENNHLAQICTILADPSYVKMGDRVNLVLSGSNEMSGSHHFIYTHQDEVKFRLEWERENEVHHTFHYKLKLYSITAKTGGLDLSVRVTLSSINKDSGSKESDSREAKEVASICSCGKPQGVPDMPRNKSWQLVGTVTLDCQKRNSTLV